MRFMTLAAATLLPFSLAACSDGKVDEAEVEDVAADVEATGVELVQEGEAALEKAGGEIEETAKEAGVELKEGTREAGDSVEAAGEDAER